MSLRCLIVEDDAMSRQLLEMHCKKFPELQLLAACKNVEEALEVMSDQEVDLIFLDIEMPGANGFELLDRCAVIPHVIVISGEEKYAYEAFQYQVIDYLGKPFRLPRFKEAIQKVMEQQASKSTGKNIFIRVDGKLIKLDLDNILYVENVGDYVCFFTEEKRYIVYSTLKSLANKLPADRFMKVHRSYIINLDKIVDIEENSILINRKIIPVSRANKSALMERLNLI